MKNKFGFENLRAVLVITMLGLLAACSSGGLKVDSEPPGADVLLAVNGQSSRTLGKTPYVATAADIDSKESAQIVVTKAGFKSESVLVPSTTFVKTSSIFVKLDANPEAPNCTVQQDALQRVARGVAEAQASIRAKNYDLAEATLKPLASQYSTVAVLQDLVGNVYYLKKDFEKALAAYRRSNELSPNNPETVRIIKRLEDLRGTPQ